MAYFEQEETEATEDWAISVPSVISCSIQDGLPLFVASQRAGWFAAVIAVCTVTHKPIAFFQLF